MEDPSVEKDENTLDDLIELDGETFLSPQEREERQAAELRAQRRKRWRDRAPADDDEMPKKQPRPPEATHPPKEAKPEKQKVDPEATEPAFNMFSDSVSPARPTESVQVVGTGADHSQQEDWDDADGYYKAVIGETIELMGATVRVRVAGVMGRGVFSTVLKCATVSNESAVALPPTMALKCIRHNDTMAKAAVQELEILLKLKGSPGIVPLLLPTSMQSPLEHRGHFLLLFDFMQYNLRDVLQKFGKGVGVAIQAVRSYFGQLLAAATHLKKHSIIHADLKPDNILVSADFSVLQLADFGSAMYATDAEHQEPTPYLVSRFYRSPEIILGIPPTYASDLWSLAVTAAELFLGDVLFRGTSNNHMLHVGMQRLGPMPNRVIRQHVVQCQKFPIPRHFEAVDGGTGYQFLQQTTDPVSGQPMVRVQAMATLTAASSTLSSQIRKARSSSDSKTVVSRFADLLQQCLNLDATRRIGLRDALQHAFFHAEATPAAETTN